MFHEKIREIDFSRLDEIDFTEKSWNIYLTWKEGRSSFDRKNNETHFCKLDKVDFMVCTQCGNFRIFLPIRFYVKSKLASLSVVSKVAISTHLQALDFDFYQFLLFVNVKNEQKIKNQRLKNGIFITSKYSKVDFTENLKDRKILKFPRCAVHLFEPFTNIEGN